MLRKPVYILLAGMVVLLAACKGPAAAPSSLAVTPTASIPAASPTPAPPTATPAPMAAAVNGEGILLSDFQSELQRYTQANPNSSASQADQQKTVLDSLIDEALLAEAARQAGHQVDDAALKARMDELNKQAGGGPALTNWINANGYTEDSFKASLRQAMLAAWQRDQIVAAVPQKAEQVHARQILVQDEDTANSIEDKLKNGADFAELAARYDPVTAGELGWFPKGYLTQPEVEAAAFALQPGQFSPVVKSEIGYHIVQVIERETDHALQPDALRALQEKAYQDWLAQRRSQSKIEVLLK